MSDLHSAFRFGAAWRAVLACALALAMVLSAAGPGLAQQKSSPKAAPKGQTRKPADSNQQQPAATSEVPPLIYSAWTKLCSKGPETGGRQVCRIGRDGRLETGLPMVGAVVMEAEGEPRKILQVLLPLGILLPRGTRVLVDNDEQGAAVLPILVCTNGACMAQTDATDDLLGKLKKGQNLYIQAYNMQQQVFTLAVPLSDFAKAYDGPPTDPKDIEERNRKLQEELAKRGRERLQQQK